jgi:hypothetical protein
MIKNGSISFIYIYVVSISQLYTILYYTNKINNKIKKNIIHISLSLSLFVSFIH